MAEKEYIEREKLDKWLLTELASLDGEEDREFVVERLRTEIPAADVRPVVLGKWIADGDGYHWTYNCSICGWKDGYPFNERHNYCPNCGADMREETNA